MTIQTMLIFDIENVLEVFLSICHYIILSILWQKSDNIIFLLFHCKAELLSLLSCTFST